MGSAMDLFVYTFGAGLFFLIFFLVMRWLWVENRGYTRVHWVIQLFALILPLVLGISLSCGAIIIAQQRLRDAHLLKPSSTVQQVDDTETSPGVHQR